MNVLSFLSVHVSPYLAYKLPLRATSVFQKSITIKEIYQVGNLQTNEMAQMAVITNPTLV